MIVSNPGMTREKETSFFLEAMSLELLTSTIMGLQGSLKVPNQQLMEVNIFQDPSWIQKELCEVGITS